MLISTLTPSEYCCIHPDVTCMVVLELKSVTLFFVLHALVGADGVCGPVPATVCAAGVMPGNGNSAGH